MSFQCYDQGVFKESQSITLGVTKDINNCKTACSNQPYCNAIYYKNDNILDGKSPCTLLEGKTPTQATKDLSNNPGGRFHRYCLRSNVVPNNATLTSNTTSSPTANDNSPATKTEPTPEDKAAFAFIQSFGIITDMDPKTSSSTSNSYILWIVLGVIFGIIFLAVVAYFIYRSKRSKSFF